jgi:hypothetical protein
MTITCSSTWTSGVSSSADFPRHGVADPRKRYDAGSRRRAELGDEPRPDGARLQGQPCGQCDSQAAPQGAALKKNQVERI